jgi:hypothetical protein
MRTILFEVSPFINGIPTAVRMCGTQSSSATSQLNGYQWLPCITKRHSRSAVWARDGILAPIDTSWGAIEFWLNNSFNNVPWAGYEWNGALARIFVGEEEKPFSSYEQVFEGSVSNLDRTGNKATVVLLGSEAALNVPLLSLTYAGTGGAEGSISMKGSYKPRAFGSCLTVAPVLIDGAKLIYQVHGYGPVTSIPNVYEFAQALDSTKNKGNAASYAALASLTLAPGEWATCTAQGMFRLGAQPSQKISADVIVGATDVASIAKAILGVAGIPGAKIGDFSQFANTSWNLFLTDQAEALETLRGMLFQAGGYIVADGTGKWQVGDYYAPQTAIVLNEDRSTFPLVRSIKEISANGPIYKVNVGYARCWNVHSESEVSPALSVISDAQIAASAAAAKASQDAAQAASDAAIAKTRLDAITSDGFLDRSEKAQLIQTFSSEAAQQSGLQNQTTIVDVSAQRAALATAFANWKAFLEGLVPAYTDTTQDTPVDRAAFDAATGAYWVAKQDLVNVSAGLGSTTSLWGGVAGPGKPEDNATVGAPLGTLVGNVPVETLIGDVGIAKTSAKDAYDNVEAAKRAIAIDVAAAKAEGTTARSEAAQVRTDLVPTISAAKAEGTTARNDLASEVSRAKDAEGTLTTKVTTAQSTADGAKTAITTETTQRTDADAALSNRTTAVESTLNTPTTGVVARLGTEETTRASADTAISNRTTALESSVNTPNTGLTARITTEETTRANADTSLGNRTTAVESTLNTPTTGVVARLGTEETTRASADSALATRATNLESTVNSTTTGNTALQSRIATEETTRSTAVAAVANRTSTLETKTGNNGSYATANASFTAWPDGSTLPSQWLPWNPGNYTRENSTFQDGAYMVGHVVPSTADSGFRTGVYVTPGYWVYDASVWCSAGNYQGAGLYADNLPSLNFSTAPDNSGDTGVKAPGIRNWSLLVNSTFTGQVNFYAMGNWSSFGATSAKTIHWLKAGLRPATDGEIKAFKADALLNTPVTGVVARITTEETTRANADTALSNRANALESTVNTPGTGLTARIGTEETTRANADTALANRTTSLEGSVNTPTTGLTARMTTEENARASADSAIVNRTNVLEATATGTSSSYAANDKFANWPVATAYPTGWQVWNTGGTYRIERVGSVGGSPYAIKTLNDTTGATSGFYQPITVHPGKWVVEATVRLDSGSWGGAGVSVNGSYNIDFVGDPDSNKQTRDSIGNGDIRTWTKMFDLPQNANLNFHAMVGWTGFNRTIQPKYLTWFRVAIRPATAGEILAGTVDTNLTAAVARIGLEETARINGDAAQALRTTTVEASIATGGNLLSSSNFVTMTGWSPIRAGNPTNTMSLNVAGDGWQPLGENSLSVVQAGGAGTAAIMYYVSDIVPVQAGKWYQFSAYVASHRADVGIGYEVYDANNGGAGGGQPVRISRGTGSNGGRDLNGWDLVYFNIQAPNTGFRMQLLKWETNPGANDSYAWFLRPQLVQVANSSAPLQAYRPATGQAQVANALARVSTTEAAVSNLNGRTSAYWQVQAVAGNNRAQMTVRADANGGAGVDIVGDVNFAGNLNVGPDSGQRTKITNQGVFIYDGNGTRRVALGINF